MKERQFKTLSKESLERPLNNVTDYIEFTIKLKFFAKQHSFLVHPLHNNDIQFTNF